MAVSRKFRGNFDSMGQGLRAPFFSRRFMGQEVRHLQYAFGSAHFGSDKGICLTALWQA
jgi:hypothetical protein